MLNFFDKDSFGFIKNMNLFQFAVLNPQIAILSYLKVGEKMASQPKKIEESHQNLLNRLMELQKKFLQDICENKSNAFVDLKYSKKNDKYEDNLFENNPVLKFALQFHETTANWMLDTLSSIEDVDPKLMHSAKFFMKQYIDMMSPNNFPFLNPKFLQKTLDTQGENIRKGLAMFLEDLNKGAITTNDASKFTIGKELASTSGKVIFQNDLIELIQYSPTTDQVFLKPILFIPPWINKFYILDLNEKLSFVKWAVDHGFTVFMISWINPDKKHCDKGFSEYIFDGLEASLNKIAEVTKVTSIHTLGYCVGGTLISAFLAYMFHPNCRRRPKVKIESATLLTTLLDFERAGDMAIFMADNYLEAIGVELEKKGYLDGQIMFNTFSALKANDMIWRYFVNSYMLGEKPSAHEILFWNADTMNITKTMQRFLAQDLYRDNLLKTGMLKLDNVPLELHRIRNVPLYMISTIKDHLVPWEASFDGIKLFNTSVRFVLGGSGHVAGAINPPLRNKYCYWVNEKITNDAQEWIKNAVEFAGSWWTDWFEWIKPKMGEMVAPRHITDFLRDAPGIYVHGSAGEPQ
ncbi:MAG: alpha/beta fold hydrolase [Holosporaceae bacterium]|jgi:polyhydroxyalkanoate synthase|nr:alpha/beta fold hydrolase [Holosporaceae bacterium]